MLALAKNIFALQLIAAFSNIIHDPKMDLNIKYLTSPRSLNMC